MTTTPSEGRKLRLGVTVGRFQVPRLHYAHMRLIGEGLASAERILILLGSPVGKPDARNPLDIKTRKLMIESAISYDNRVAVDVVYDVAFKDDIWSNEVDARIDEHIRHLVLVGSAHLGEVEVVMFGGRDSFLKHYIGRHRALKFEMAQVGNISGTEDRARAGRDPLNTSDFRAGIIYAYENMEIPHNAR